jgi:hypothetical protein
MLQELISRIFVDPNISPDQIGKKLSILYCLRRDIATCFGNDPQNPNNKLAFKAEWPGTMAIMAGIDLLAKYCYGDHPSKSGERFKDFLQEYLDIPKKDDNDDNEALYQLRNSLLHSFGLYSESERTRKIYRFVLDPTQEKLISSNETKFIVNNHRLANEFNLAIEKLMKKLLESDEDSQIQVVFRQMVSKYGFIEVSNGNSIH